jgi:hypothetical protein
MVAERQAGVRRPSLGTPWWTAFAHLRRPPPEVLEDATDDWWILDSSAMTRIGPLHLGHSKGSASYTLRMSRAQADAQVLSHPLGDGDLSLDCDLVRHEALLGITWLRYGNTSKKSAQMRNPNRLLPPKL